MCRPIWLCSFKVSRSRTSHDRIRGYGEARPVHIRWPGAMRVGGEHSIVVADFFNVELKVVQHDELSLPCSTLAPKNSAGL